MGTSSSSQSGGLAQQQQQQQQQGNGGSAATARNAAAAVQSGAVVDGNARQRAAVGVLNPAYRGTDAGAGHGASSGGRGRAEAAQVVTRSAPAAPAPLGEGVAPPRAPLGTGESSATGASGAAGAEAARSGSSPRGNGPCWCLVKAKTRQPSSVRVSRKLLWFEGKQGATFTIGRSPSCDLWLDDDRCAPLNSVLEPTLQNETHGIRLTPRARMYQLVGMGAKKVSNEMVIQIGSVLKVGSVSLEVIDMCTDDSDDFTQRFAAEIDESRGRMASLERRRSTARVSKEREVSSNGGDSEESMDDEQALARPSQTQADVESDDREDVDGAESDQDLPSDEEDAMCYICWGSPDNRTVEEAAAEAAAAAENGVVAPGNDASVVTETVRRRQDQQRKVNPLIQNPCGQCSGSSRYVHLNCLLTWIKSSGSGHCSICNGPLPQHFSSPPPFIELKVVRHRRGEAWVGSRRFRLSFADRDIAIIGRSSDADIRLRDRSVGNMHARLFFNREKRQFEISDCSSLGGTFLQVKGHMDLTLDTSTYLKIGRTLLTLRMTQKRGTLLNMFQHPLSWTKR